MVKAITQKEAMEFLNRLEYVEDRPEWSVPQNISAWFDALKSTSKLFKESWAHLLERLSDSDCERIANAFSDDGLRRDAAAWRLLGCKVHVAIGKVKADKGLLQVV